ncbi:MAG: CYTH domain-containing protein [Gammaproteobacteria bacterium]|nr:CYTH domain-containing protein [Gammaproteobacteria bacterium]MCP5135541.1 CYTH domain-containing protein [Gammaproteobacteria bacterium]
MAIEIERKFLVISDAFKVEAERFQAYRQGYMIGSEKASVRVRISGDQARLNIKSATLGVRRQEYEYPMPLEDAQRILDDLCEKPLVEKVRYYVRHGAHLWEVDVFEGDNAGLVVAEIELGAVDERFEKPDWLGKEVSDDVRYYNSNLGKHPYKDWT